MSRHPILLITTLAALLLQSATGQASDTDKLANDDIKFAENLARFQYYSLARMILDDVQSRDLDSEVEGTAQWTQSRIVKRESANTADDAERERLLTSVIDDLQDWAKPGSRFAYHDHRTDALWDLAESYHERGRLYAQLGRNNEAEEDFKQADQTYNALERECEDRAQQFEDLEQVDQAAIMAEQAALTFFWRGRNAIEWAKIAADREFRLEQAREMLVEFQWEADSESLPFYMAQHYEAVAYALEEEYGDAIELLEELIETASEVFWVPLQDYSDGARARIAELFDMTWAELAAVHLKAGDAAQAQATIQAMRDAHAAKDQPFGRVGYDALLGWADTLMEQGRTREASDVVKFVADNALGLPQGERARRLMADIVSAGGAAAEDLSAGALVAAADGEYQNKNYADAAFLFQRAIASLTTEAERKEFELQAWLGAGKALFRQDRYLEAALTYDHAREIAMAANDTDTAEAAANQTYQAYNARFRQTNHDFDKNLRDQSGQMLQQMGIVGDVAFRQAVEIFTEASGMPDDTEAAKAAKRQAFAAALQEFEGVATDAPSYERALVYQARCLAGMGQADDALARFDELLARADDSSLDPTNPKDRQRREQALAECLYWKADLLLSSEVGRPTEALALIDGFEERLAGQTGFFEQVKYQRVSAHAHAGQPSEADAALDQLRDFAPESSYVPVAAFFVARAYNDAAVAAQEAGDADLYAERLERAAELMWEYSEGTGFRIFGHILLTGEWFAAVSRYQDADRAYAAAIDQFEGRLDDATLDEAKIGLALVRDAQLEFGRSRDLWVALVGRNPRVPRIMVGAARSFGGWLEVGPDGTITEIPGSGNYDEALDLWTQLLKSASVTAKYQEPWWEAKLGAVYVLHRAGAADEQFSIQARKLIENQKLLTPNYDEDTMGSLPPDVQFEPRFKTLFRYLDRVVAQ